MSKDMKNDIERVFFTEEEIEAKVKELGEQISKDFEGKDPLFVGVLKGCFVFMSDLMRHVTIPCSVDFMAVSSYKGTTSTGAVSIQKDLSQNIEGRHVVMVEDILDSGKTLHYISEMLRARKPASIKICTFLDKPERRMIKDLKADYAGTEVPDEFVVGYGLDYAEKYRNVPFLGVLSRSVYEK